MDSKNPDSTAQSERPENKVRGTPSKKTGKTTDKRLKPHPGNKNLHTPTSEEAREIGRKGGLRSGEVRRVNRDLRADLQRLLSLTVTPGPEDDLKGVTDLDRAGALNLTIYEAGLCALLRKFADGDTKAAKLILDGSGLSLPTQQEVTVTGSLAGYTDAQIAEALDAISGKKPKRA